MLKGMTISKKPATLLLTTGMRWLTLCVAILLTSCSVFALFSQPPMANTAVNLQSGGTVNVTVSSTGCSPSSATQAAGQVTLKVVNQTGKAELAVQLYDSNGVLLREAYITQGATEWSETFNLPAGNYTLLAGHNQDWTCHLTVQ